MFMSLRNSVMMFYVLFVFVSVMLCETGQVLCSCMREHSRTVRRIISKELVSAFESVSVDIPRTCPFHPDLDLYLPQEEHKTMETVTKWVCEFCGKAFTSEFLLDRHFDNRHGDRISQEKDKICLSDYCDIFRCDVVSSRGKADYWEVALCIEDDLAELRQKCENTMDLCVPAHITRNASDTLKGMIYTGVCSYLTCHSYWETPFPQESQTYQILYVMASVMVLFALIMYYCVVLNYYYSDEWDPPVNRYHEHSSEQMLWRPRAQYDPLLAAQQRPRVAATRRKAQHCPGSAS